MNFFLKIKNWVLNYWLDYWRGKGKQCIKAWNLGWWESNEENDSIFFFCCFVCLGFFFFFFFSWFRCVIVKYNKEGSKITKGQWFWMVKGKRVELKLLHMRGWYIYRNVTVCVWLGIGLKWHFFAVLVWLGFSWFFTQVSEWKF